MLDIKELYWAAGFLEGEGYFHIGGKKFTSPVINAAQVNPEPIYRLKQHLGGKVYGPYRNGKHNPYFRWAVMGPSAVELMMTMFVLLSVKRQQNIAKAIAVWRAAPGANYVHKRRTHCRSGHEYTSENSRWVGNKRNCRACESFWAKKHLLKKLEASQNGLH